MEIAKGVEMLSLPMRFWGTESTIHPLMLYDDEDGVTLVDTGLPGHEELILAELRRLGLAPGDVRRIILTHQDFDHIGGAPGLLRQVKAQVLAHGDDAPYIQGERLLLKLEPARREPRLAALPPAERAHMERYFANVPKVPVDRLLADGEELPVHGGVVAIHSPGHTPGHLSLFLRAHGLLVSADALRVEEGQLLGPNPHNTLDMETATRSLQKFLAYPVEHVLCYHGGLYGPNAAARLRELAGSSQAGA